MRAIETVQAGGCKTPCLRTREMKQSYVSRHCGILPVFSVSEMAFAPSAHEVQFCLAANGSETGRHAITNPRQVRSSNQIASIRLPQSEALALQLEVWST